MKIEEETKVELMQNFSQITPKGGRQLLKDSTIFILLEWDITNPMIFYVVRKEKETKFNIEEEVKEAHNGVKYSNEHKALVIWSV